MRPVLIAAAGVLAYASWLMMNQAQAAEPEAQPGGWLADADRALSGAVDLLGDWGMLRISEMWKVKPEMLADKNVKAMLRVIRAGEGTADADGYRRIFGGQLFEGFGDHPRIKVSKSGYTSTAAGAYQFLASVWDETRREMGLTDFSPASQDMGALGRIAARGALDDVLAGRFETAVGKLGREWASLPGSPYGQPTRTLAQAKAVYLASGGAAVLA